ncbi:hypothetical protein U1Q18_032879 [Sarracenia purpurea var. burkii]
MRSPPCTSTLLRAQSENQAALLKNSPLRKSEPSMQRGRNPVQAFSPFVGLTMDLVVGLGVGLGPSSSIHFGLWLLEDWGQLHGPCATIHSQAEFTLSRKLPHIGSTSGDRVLSLKTMVSHFCRLDLDGFCSNVVA